jgi:hypothetical protein
MALMTAKRAPVDDVMTTAVPPSDWRPSLQRSLVAKICGSPGMLPVTSAAFRVSNTWFSLSVFVVAQLAVARAITSRMKRIARSIQGVGIAARGRAEKERRKSGTDFTL